MKQKAKEKKRMTPTQRCRRGQRLSTDWRDLAPQVTAACSQKLLPQHSACTRGLCQMPNHSSSHGYVEVQFYCCSQGAGGTAGARGSRTGVQRLPRDSGTGGKGQGRKRTGHILLLMLLALYISPGHASPDLCVSVPSLPYVTDLSQALNT